MKNYNSTNWGVRLERLGYALAGNIRDNIGRTWKYRAASYTYGAVAYFNSLSDMALWVRQVEEARLMIEHPERHAQGVTIGIYPIPFTMLPFDNRIVRPYHSDPLATQ